MGQLNSFSGGAAGQEAWFGKSLKGGIGLAKKDWLPNSGDYNIWFDGHCTSFNQSGGEREADSVMCMGGFNKQFRKPQSNYEITLDLIPVDTTFDELQLGGTGFFADLFDSHADATAIQADWSESGDATAPGPTLDTTNFLSGKQGMLLTWTFSGGSATWILDLSTHLGTTQDISGFAGTAAANADRGRAEAIVYIGDSTDLSRLTTISLVIGSAAGSADSQYDYTVSGNMQVGWNRVVWDLTTADSSNGSTDWSALDKVSIILTETADSSTGVTIDRIRIYDPIVSSEQVPGFWRLTLLNQTDASATVGEKRRMEIRDCQVVSWEPTMDADGHMTATVTLQAPPLDASGNTNILIEHTPDASEAALTAQENY